ncbi:MAG: UPF0175 family protein, partial [Bacteroidota bacterium]
MRQKNFQIDLPSDILLTLNENESGLKKQIKFALATQLYLQGKITLGKAAQIAQVSRMEFEVLLSESGLPISLLEMD